MIDYTPYREYKEVVDPEQPSYISVNKLLSIFVFILLLFCIFYFLGFSIGNLFISLSFLLIFIFFYIYGGDKPPTKALLFEPIKLFIGYDFGNDFKLMETSSRDYKEYLLIFPEESFTALRAHLETIPETSNQNPSNGRVVRHSFKDEPGKGFHLNEGSFIDGNGKIESIEVDYSERTMKCKFRVY